MTAKERYFTINLWHKAYQFLSTCNTQCHCLHHHIRCLNLPHPHS